ncbi:MAG TPA: TIR domain-containing protein [Malonomonas sp.]
MEKATKKGRIFLSYRREDSSGYAGRLFDHIKRHFGQDRVFMDISNIEPGVDFVDSIEKALNSCDTFLVLIGKNWLDCRDASGNRRLDDPDDFIRIETSAALKRDVRVFPILVKGAVMPSAKDLPEDMARLARRNAHELSDQRWEFDCNELMAVLETIVGPPDKQPVAPKPDDDINQPIKKEKKNIKAIIGLAIAALLFMTLLSEGFNDFDSFVGALIMAVIALLFGVLGWYDVKMKKVGGKGLAVGCIVSAVLVALMLVGLFSSEPATVYQGTTAPIMANEAAPPRDDTAARAPVAVGKQASPRVVPLSGRWQGSDGMTYMFEQDGNSIQVFGLNQFGVPMMTGQGWLGPPPLHFNYSLADGSSGEFTLQVVAEGRTMNATYTNHSTGEYGSILLNRQPGGY